MKKVFWFFPLKDKNMYHSCKIYLGDCICKDDYIGVTERNVVTRLREHNNPTHDSEPANHLKNQLNRSFNCFTIADASNNKQTQKILEAIHIVLKRRPKLNDQAKYCSI